MMPHPLVRPTPGTLVASVNMAGCESCRTALAAAMTSPTTVTADGMPAGTVAAVTDCPDGDVTFHIASLDGRVALSLRYEETSYDDLSRPVFAIAFDSHRQGRSVARALSMLANLSAWGVEDSMSGQDAVEALTRALVWADSGYGPQFMNEWVAAGARNPMDAESWTDGPMSREAAARWMAMGIASAWQARPFTDAGIDVSAVSSETNDPRTFAFVHGHGLPEDYGWFVPSMWASAGVARAALAQGVTSGPLTALCMAMGPVVATFPAGDEVTFGVPGLMFTSRWGSGQEAAMEGFVLGLDGFDWKDATLCLRAGMTFEETLAHLRSGGDMAPVRAMEALAR